MVINHTHSASVGTSYISVNTLSVESYSVPPITPKIAPFVGMAILPGIVKFSEINKQRVLDCA